MKKTVLLGILAVLAAPIDFDMGVAVAPLVKSLKRQAKTSKTPKAILKGRPAKKTICFIKGIEKDMCVYRCRNGSTLRIPVRVPDPWDRGPVIACSQMVIPF